MTLDQAIKHCEEVAEEKIYEYQECVAVHDMEDAMACGECAEEHEQLAEWLKDYKRLLEQKPCGDAVSREDVIKAVDLHTFNTDDGLCLDEDITIILEELPPVTPTQKKGKWIKSNYENMNTHTVRQLYCSECGSIHHDKEAGKWREIFDFRYAYCPLCGAEMGSEEE